MRLNIQIIPAPDTELGRMVQLPARDGQGEEMECLHCGGAGQVYRAETCRKCGGAGRRQFVIARRISVDSANMADVSALLDGLGRETYRWQNTVELAERGTGGTNAGHACIICGLKGEPLPAVHTNWRCGRDNATFYVHAAMVVEYGHNRGNGRGNVSLVGVDGASRHRLGVEHVTLWRFFDQSDEPEIVTPDRAASLSFPAAAVAAARAKAKTYHARGAHYAADAAPAQSGALTGAGAAFGGMPSPMKGPGIGYDAL